MNIAKLRNGVILLCVGIVFLLNTLEYVDWSVWFGILSLWPVILIAIGIEKIFKRTRFELLSLLSPLLLALAILGPVYFHSDEWKGFSLGKAEVTTTEKFKWEKDIPLGLKKVEAFIDFKAGNLEISEDSANLFSSQLDYWDIEPFHTYNFYEKDSSLSFRIKDRSKKWKHWFWETWEEKDWSILLHPQIPFELNVEGKACKMNLDLSNLNVETLILDLKACRSKIKFGSKVKEVKAKIESDASKLTILIPEDCGLKIDSQGKLTQTSFSNISIAKTEDQYQTTNYQTAVNRVDLILDGAISKLKVETY